MLSRLFWSHPEGDATIFPCTHLVPQHPSGDSVQVPCVHWGPQHSNGDQITLPVPGNPKITIPCAHFVQQHANDSITVPCVHLVAQHPNGHPGPTVPCFHPMPVKRRVESLGLVFYTDDAFIQEEAIKAVRKLQGFDVMMASPLRPLNVFHREFLMGYPSDNSNPFWSHYDPLTHSVQVTKRNVSQSSLRDTLHHELGHATLGHQCVQITTGGGEHGMKTVSEPSVAMSEGWAHFVALAIRHEQTENLTTAAGGYKGEKWEARDSNVPKNRNIEYNVACTLWDCFDVSGDGTSGTLGGISVQTIAKETATLPFKELFRVYRPTLETMPHGPLIPNLDNYVERLIANNPGKADAIKQARTLNCG